MGSFDSWFFLVVCFLVWRIGMRQLGGVDFGESPMSMPVVDTVVLVLGALASAGFISANYVLDRRWSIGLLIAASSVLVLQYGPVMGLWGLAALNFLFILRNISFWVERWARYREWLFWGWLLVSYAAYIPLTLSSAEGFTVLTSIPLVSILVNTLALRAESLMGLKVFLTLNSLSWMTFDVIGGLWGNFIGDAFGVAAGTVAVVRLLLVRRTADR